MTDGVSYEKGWLYQGRMMMTALVEPAVQIQAVMNTAAAQPEDVRLRGSFLEKSQLLELAEAVQRRVPALAGRRSYPDAVRLMKQHIGKAMADLAAVTPDQLRHEGLGTRDFVMARLGVSAPHAVVLLSASLLDAPHQIEACMSAIRQDAPLPEVRTPMWASQAKRSHRALARTTQWLRLRERTDRHAHSYGNGDADDKAGHQMVRKALKTFDACPPSHALGVLGVDPRWWFGS
jgi:hypothetical protein